MRKENITTQTLASLQNGENGLIIRVSGEGAFRKRLTEMGFIRGKVVKVIKNWRGGEGRGGELRGFAVI